MDYNVGIYIRLSKEDNDKFKNESESITNQRQLLYKYVSEKGYNLKYEYVDDGYSGTNFDRPGFKKMIDDIEQGKINMVVTKDLSRLGRDYIKSGYYVENYFPEKKVRYVSLLDGVDTKEDNNDIAPFKALFNDMVSKDTSKKITAILQNKKQQGLFLGNSAPYGYIKDPNNKYHLIIDDYASKIVKEIFNLKLENKTNIEIANILNERNIDPPSKYKKQTTKTHQWGPTSIYNILTNKEYTGCLVSNVWTKVSYKNKKRVKRNFNKWIIIPNCHEAIISEDIYNKINNKNNVLKQVYCYECNKPLSLTKMKGRLVFICPRYKKKECTTHYYNYQKLLEKVDLTLVDRIYIDKDKNIIVKDKICD